MKIGQEIHTKDRVILESLRLFHEQGFQATTMRQIASAVGCDVANLYNYVESKQALLNRFVNETSLSLTAGFKQIVDSNTSPEQKISAVVDLYCNIIEQGPYQTSIFFNEWKSLREIEKKEYQDTRKSYEQVLVKIIKRGSRDERFSVGNSLLSAKIILSSFEWLGEYILANDEALDHFKIKKELLSSTLKSLKA